MMGLAALVTLAGCTKYDVGTVFTTPERADRGMVVILPGIEGQSAANLDIRRGLRDAEVPYALTIYRWGSPLPGPAGMLINQTDVAGNRRAGQELAGQITKYQRNHPNRPVFLIGHSAGGGIAVFALEELAKLNGAKPIEGAFLLSSSISANYPLDGALRMVKRGIVNVHNPDDRLLKEGTSTFGNVDGGRGDSAGRTGFSRSYAKVFDREITNERVRREFGQAGSPHFVATNAALIEKYAPAWLLSETWPPARPGVIGTKTGMPAR